MFSVGCETLKSLMREITFNIVAWVNVSPFVVYLVSCDFIHQKNGHECIFLLALSIRKGLKK